MTFSLDIQNQRSASSSATVDGQAQQQAGEPSSQSSSSSSNTSDQQEQQQLADGGGSKSINGTNASANANTSSSGAIAGPKRYPGQPQEARRTCLRESRFGEEQVIRLILQELRDRGLVDSFEKLQSESGYTLEDEPITKFRDCILDGRWADVENTLPSIGVDSQERLN
ncbi:hypothetical protein GGI12_003795, partial [Dipsacomyces acuminosporus]